MADMLPIVLMPLVNLCYLAICVWLIKQLLILIRYFIKIFVEQERKIDNIREESKSEQ